MSNIIVGAAVLWAMLYSGHRVYRFVKDAGSGGPVKCACSGCSCSAAKKI